MKQNWPFKVLAALLLLIPLVVFPQTFDQFGTPKLAVFLFLSGLLFIALLGNLKQLARLPRYLLVAYGFFLLIQAFQTLRLNDIAAGFFGDDSQSESLIVQLSFMIICLAGYLFVGTETARRKIWRLILLLVYLTSVYGIFQYFHGDVMTHRRAVRIISFLGNPNHLGVFLVLTLPLVIAEFKRSSTKWSGYSSVAAGGIFLGIITLFLSFSREAWLGFFLSLIILFGKPVIRVLRKRDEWKKEFIVMTAVLIIVCAGVGTGQVLTHLQPAPHKDYTLTARLESVTSRPNDSGRSLIWATAWQAFKKSPLLGYGIGSFPSNFHYFATDSVIQHWGPIQNLEQTHNEFLHFLATQGMIGMLSYLGLLVALFWSARVVDLFQPSAPDDEVPLWSAVFGYLFCMQFSYPLVHYSFIFWMYLGILLRFKYPCSPRSAFRLKPAATAIIAVFIGLWGIFLCNIFRADLLFYQAAKFDNSPKSFMIYQKAVQLTPWIHRYRFRYALSLYRAAVWEQQKKGDPRVAGQYLNTAAAHLKVLIKSEPFHYEIRFLLGRIAESQGNLMAANIYYRQAHSLYPKNYIVSFRLAKTEFLMGNKKEAFRIFLGGAKINPLYMQEMRQKENVTL